MVSVLTGASIATLRAAANGILMTIVGIAIRTLILTDTLTFAVASIEAGIAFAQTHYATGILEFDTIRVHPARQWCTRWRFLDFNLRWRRTTGDTVSNEVIDADAHGCVVGRHDAPGVLMTNEFDTDIFWKTLQGTPFYCNIVMDVTSVGEDGVVARETTAFEFLGRIIIDAEGAASVPTSTWIDR